MMRKLEKFSVALALLFLSGSAASAQISSFREEYESFREQGISTYSSFRDECNHRYSEFLKYAWEWYNSSSALPSPIEKEKPPVVIDDEKKDEPIEDNELPYKDVTPAPVVEPQPEPVEPVKPVPVIEESRFEFEYLGTLLSVRAGDSMRFYLKKLNGNSISSGWKKLMNKAYDNLLSDCLELRKDQKLCDWAYLMMLKTFSEKFLGPGNESVLLTSYLFSQSGYKMRLGMEDKKLILMFGSNHQIYDLKYFNIDGECFYPLGEVGDNIRLANFKFPQEKNLSLVIQSEPVLAKKESKGRTLAGKKYATKANCIVNTNLIGFFDSYPSSQLNDNPMTRWAMYANTPLDESVKRTLYPPLKQAVEGKSSLMAANILLNFVQTAFEYEYDDKVWGGDRAFFAEESLYYPYCDCEDRSILFSRLIRDLLGLDVVLVYYPGHLATAVKFNENVDGDYITLQQGRFVVCDPTYIGASVGMTMPSMDNNTARVILLN